RAESWIAECRGSGSREWRWRRTGTALPGTSPAARARRAAARGIPGTAAISLCRPRRGDPPPAHGPGGHPRAGSTGDRAPGRAPRTGRRAARPSECEEVVERRPRLALAIQIDVDPGAGGPDAHVTHGDPRADSDSHALDAGALRGLVHRRRRQRRPL